MDEINKYSEFYLIRMLKWLCNSYDVLTNEYFAEQGLTSMQSEILNFLCHTKNGSSSTNEILMIFKIRHSSLSNVLKCLSEKGYIRYDVTENDMRAKEVFLTDKALNEKSTIHEKFSKIYKKIFEDISVEEFAGLQATSNKILQSIIKQHKELKK